jgi:hypothetical protein
VLPDFLSSCWKGTSSTQKEKEAFFHFCAIHLLIYALFFVRVSKAYEGEHLIIVVKL